MADRFCQLPFTDQRPTLHEGLAQSSPVALQSRHEVNEEVHRAILLVKLVAPVRYHQVQKGWDV